MVLRNRVTIAGVNGPNITPHNIPVTNSKQIKDFQFFKYQATFNLQEHPIQKQLDIRSSKDNY